ncbi:MAG: ArnT family glycosyltransferase [Candidatus Helarchaeota archaeon]
MKREYWILLIITAVAFCLRFASILIGFSLQANLDTSIFPDEANFLVSARYFLMGNISPYYVYYHNSLILSPLIAGLYSLFGVTAFAGRFLSITFGALTVPLTYLTANQLFKNEKKALLAAFLLSVSFIHRFWTIRALADGPLTFFFVLSLYLFIRAIHSADWRWYIIAGISTTITILVKYPGLLIFPIIFIYLTISIYLKQVEKKALLYYLLTLGIFAFSILSLLLSQFILPFQPLDQISYFLSILFSGTSNPFYYIFNTLELSLIWGLLLFILIGIVLFYSLRQHTEGDVFIIAWLAVVFIFFSLYGASELYRYLLPAFPALYILIGHFFVEIFRKYKFSFQKFKLSQKTVIALLCGALLGAFITAELTVGESLIVKRSNTYTGIYQMSTWFNMNGTQGAVIMAPSNSLAQFDYYTGGKFQYIALSAAETDETLWIDIKNYNVTYIILSEHFPETLTLEVYSIIPNNTTHYALNFTYSDGKFETSLYLVIP